MGLLDGGIKAEIGLNEDILSLMLDGTLISKTDGALDNGYFIETEVEYPIKGFLDTRRDAVLIGGSNTVFGSSQRIANIIAHGLDYKPKVNDVLVLQGETSRIQTIEIDPAGALWTLVITRV